MAGYLAADHMAIGVDQLSRSDTCQHGIDSRATADAPADVRSYLQPRPKRTAGKERHMEAVQPRQTAEDWHKDPASAWSSIGRKAGWIAGAALLAGTVLFLLDATGVLGSGPVYHATSAGPVQNQATFYAQLFAHQHHVVWDIIGRDTLIPIAYLALIVVALAVRNVVGERSPAAQLMVGSFVVGGVLSILADLTYLGAAEYWRHAGWSPHPATIMVVVGRTVEGIDTLTHWPEAFGFAVLACGLFALGRLCRKSGHLPDGLGSLAYLEAALLLGVAVTGLIPFDAGYQWLSLAAGAVVGPAVGVWLGTSLGRHAAHPSHAPDKTWREGHR